MPFVELADGSTVLFRAPGARGDFEAQGAVTDKVKAKLTEVTERTGQVLREAVNGVRASLSSVAPSELEIEIGICVSEEGSVIVSSAKAEASLTIKAVWKNQSRNND
jgi:hypothetical protein